MSVLTALARLFGGAVVANGSAQRLEETVNFRIEARELPYASMYGLLKIMYRSVGAYEDLAHARVVLGRQIPQMKSIRNPVPVVVDFFGAKTYPKPLTLVTEKPAIVAPIEQVWRWSNWRAKSSMFAGWSALCGEAYLYVRADQERGRVWFEYIEPLYVTDFEEDPRGFIVWIRIDTPKVDEDAAGGRRSRTITEEWSTAEQVYRRWETDGEAAGRKLSDLGAVAEEIPYSVFAIDFTPFVRVPFSDDGDKRGTGAVQRALEAIFEADLSATNLHAMLYQDADGAWVATAAGADANGRPIPPLRVAAAEPTFDALGRQTSNGTGTQEDGSISVGKRSFWRLPPGYDLKSVVPDIDYESALAILESHITHLETLMPALAYGRVSMLDGDLSGRAIRYRLSAAVDQVLDVRATALEKLAQADAMALTLGKVNGIQGFADVGDFDQGDFEHTFAPVDVIEIDELERAQGALARGQAGQAYITAGIPLATVLVDVFEKTEEDALKIVNLAAAESEAAAERFGLPPGGQGDGSTNDAE